jgi:hypothetical protein
MKCPYCSEKLQVYRIDNSECLFHCVFCLKDVNPKEIVPDKKVEDIYDHQAHVCECGSVHFNLLRSGKVECARCAKSSCFQWWRQDG